MSIKATILYVDGATSTCVFDTDEPPLRWMQTAVGGLIEFIPDLQCSVVVNSDRAALQLPVNELAARRFGSAGAPDEWLRGNVIVIEYIP